MSAIAPPSMPAVKDVQTGAGTGTQARPARDRRRLTSWMATHPAAELTRSSYTRDSRMHLLTRVRRALWIACACVLLSAPLARAADRSLAADFDGDGKSDRVAIDRSEPSVLHVWLSRTGTTDRLHNPRALLWIAATDVDGDNRPELIATEASAEGLRIWKRDGARRGFRPYAPRRSPAHATPPTNGRTVGEFPDDAEDALAGSVSRAPRPRRPRGPPRVPRQLPDTHRVG